MRETLDIFYYYLFYLSIGKNVFYVVLVGYRGSKKQGHEVYLLCYMIDRYKEENFNIFYNSMTSKISKILTGAVIDNLINDRCYIKGKFICKKPFLENWAVIAKTGIYGGRYKQVSLQ